MKKIKLVVIRKVNGDHIWYKEHIGHLFFTTDTTDDKLLAIVRPQIGKDFDLQIMTDTLGNGVVMKEDVQVILELNVV